jgi:formate/nitrite transporter FocA (FNT family)
MSVAPDPDEIFNRAVSEGQRRLDQSLLELVANSFIAGFTVVFGIIALGMAETFVPSRFGELAKIAGALAFGVGFVFLIVGRTELFNENFFDSIAAAVDNSDAWMLGPLFRLWLVTFAFNLVGGGLFILVFLIDGVLPPGTEQVLSHTAAEIAHRRPIAEFGKGIVGGALVALLSFLLEAVDGVGSRISLLHRRCPDHARPLRSRHRHDPARLLRDALRRRRSHGGVRSSRPFVAESRWKAGDLGFKSE